MEMTNSTATIILFIGFTLLVIRMVYSLIKIQKKIWGSNLDEQVIKTEKRKFFKYGIIGMLLMLLLFLVLGLMVNFG